MDESVVMRQHQLQLPSTIRKTQADNSYKYHAAHVPISSDNHAVRVLQLCPAFEIYLERKSPYNLAAPAAQSNGFRPDWR